MASGAVAVTVVLILGNLFLTDICCVRATSMEAATLGRICRGRDVSFKNDTVHLNVGIGMGDCGEQSLCLRMERI